MAQAGVSPTPQTLRLTLTTAFWREQHTWTAEELDNVRDDMSLASTLPCHRHSDYRHMGRVSWYVEVCTGVTIPYAATVWSFSIPSPPFDAFWLSFPLEPSSGCTVAHL